jgi:alanyl-tRNA synthetase
VTVFEGEPGIPRDDEAIAFWKEQGVAEDHIYPKGREDNWWGPAGQTGPCGPDTEMFVDTGKEKCCESCSPGCGCGKYIEIWNDVFMQYNKTADGTYEPLAQHNVDTGMGVERTICMINGYKTVYESELFLPLLNKIRELAKDLTALNADLFGTGDKADDLAKDAELEKDKLYKAVYYLVDAAKWLETYEAYK